MEFSFKAYDFLLLIAENPQYMVFWAAFGVPLLMLVLTIPLYIWRKIGFLKLQKATSEVLYVSLVITWIFGFVVVMVLHIGGLSGIKLLFIWVLLLMCCGCFALFNRRMIHRFIKEDYKKLKINKGSLRDKK